MSSTMSRLEAAERRLEDALARFETALAKAGGRDALAEVTEGIALKDECVRLSDALSDVRERNDALRRMSRDAATRLDDAIAQIDLLLED